MSSRETEILDPDHLKKMAQEAVRRLKRNNYESLNQLNQMKREKSGMLKNYHALLGEAKAKGLDKVIEKLKNNQAKNKTFDRSKLKTLTGWSISSIAMKIKEKTEAITASRSTAKKGISR